MRATGRERRIDTVRRHRDVRGVDAVEALHVVARPLRDNEHMIGASRGAGNNEPEGQPVEQAHSIPSRLEREIVERHHRAAVPTERQRVLEVRELGLQLPKQLRQ